MGLKDLQINLKVGRIGVIINDNTKLAKNCVTTETIAAPAAPMIGIKIKLPITFKTAPDRLMIHKYFCFSSANIQIFLTVPMYEKAEYQVMICKSGIAAIYA